MEEYKIIKDFSNYSVSNLGNVKNNSTGRILRPRLDRDSYKMCGLNTNGIKKICPIHRLVAQAFILNPSSKKQVDHIDNNRLNNNVDNLRWVTIQENQFNRQLSVNNTSGVKGVCYNKQSNKWRATIMVNSKTINIGYYNTIEEATEARQKKANELFGEFTNKCEKLKTTLLTALTELEQLEAQFNAIQ
jgi:hypothetical protein